MNPLLVDSHCHLDLIEAGAHGGLDAVVARARGQGVGYLLCACVNLESFASMRALSRAYEGVFLSVGVHPNEHPPAEPACDDLMKLARDPGVVAIGETGLDTFRSSGDLGWQHERLVVHVQAARASGLPLIIHCRDAKEDTLRLLECSGAAQVGGVMHCFVEDWDAARRAMDLNFHISFSGIVTFKNATALQAVARRVPLDRLLVETDAPYLAPVPHRGKPNEPAYVRHVAEHIAALRGVELEEIAEATTRNFFELFPRAATLRAAASRPSNLTQSVVHEP